MTDTELRHYRTIWLSDVHLGTPGCRADYLLDFLRVHSTETLYLVGDILDGWRLRKGWYWPQTHNDVIQKILRSARKGTRVIYVPGNHDEVSRQFIGLSFGGSVSVRLGLDVPERVESVMAFMPWNAGGTEPGDPFMAQLHDSWADPDAVRHVVEFISLDPARTTDVQQTMTGAVSEAFWRRWYGAGVFTSMLDELPGMTVPVCYVLGGRDTVAPRDALIGDVLAMPGGRLVLLAEAGHLAPYEHPELVATEVREFVGRVAARPVEA